jgi:hypothetical protein
MYCCLDLILLGTSDIPMPFSGFGMLSAIVSLQIIFTSLSLSFAS